MPGVPGGVTARGLSPMGEHDCATFVPLHRIVGPGSPEPMKAGLWPTSSQLGDSIGHEHARRAGVDDACVPVYTCPLASEGVSQHCPSPQPAPALQAAVGALAFARASLPWGSPRERTTEATRAIALGVASAQSAAEAYKAQRGKVESGW